jgi:hypothetical protein
MGFAGDNGRRGTVVLKTKIPVHPPSFLSFSFGRMALFFLKAASALLGQK